VIGPAYAADIVRAFAGAEFSGEERHRRRLDKVLEIEGKGTA
jgi:ribose 5-phosphate isomerase B